MDAVHLYVTSDGYGDRTAMVALTPEEARRLAVALVEEAEAVERINRDPA